MPVGDVAGCAIEAECAGWVFEPLTQPIAEGSGEGGNLPLVGLASGEV